MPNYLQRIANSGARTSSVAKPRGRSTRTDAADRAAPEFGHARRDIGSSGGISGIAHSRAAHDTCRRWSRDERLFRRAKRWSKTRAWGPRHPQSRYRTGSPVRISRRDSLSVPPKRSALRRSRQSARGRFKRFPKRRFESSAREQRGQGRGRRKVHRRRRKIRQCLRASRSRLSSRLRGNNPFRRRNRRTQSRRHYCL